HVPLDAQASVLHDEAGFGGGYAVDVSIEEVARGSAVHRHALDDLPKVVVVVGDLAVSVEIRVRRAHQAPLVMIVEVAPGDRDEPEFRGGRAGGTRRAFGRVRKRKRTGSTRRMRTSGQTAPFPPRASSVVSSVN